MLAVTFKDLPPAWIVRFANAGRIRSARSLAKGGEAIGKATMNSSPP